MVTIVFKDSEGNFHDCSPGDLIDSGVPIEGDGPNEGEDMEYIGIGIIQQK